MERTAIGFYRRIDVAWLDEVATCLASGDSEDQIHRHLEQFLEGAVTDQGKRSARDKTISVLLHIWVRIPPRATSLRERALKQWGEASPPERPALHWAMALATYPFFADVATATGRLLALQGNLTLAQLTRRLKERWGDRSTMVRAAQRVIRSMIQWGALQDGAHRGVYEARPATNVKPLIAELLLEAMLLNSDRAAFPLDHLMAHPACFPFKLAVGAHQVRSSATFNVYREGLDMELVELAPAPP